MVNSLEVGEVDQQSLSEGQSFETNNQQISSPETTSNIIHADEIEPSPKDKGLTMHSWLSICVHPETEIDEQHKAPPRKSIKRSRGRPTLKDKPTTSSERGKELRKRQTLTASKLITDVGILKSNVDELAQYRNLLCQTILRKNSMIDGSYVMGVIQYLSMFQRGCPKVSIRKDALQIQAQQAQFLKSLMTSDVAMVDIGTGIIVHGPGEIFDQWNRQSMSHATFGVRPGIITVIPSYPTPVVRVQSAITAKFSRATLEAFYRHILPHNAVVRNLIGLDVQFELDLKFHFNEDGYVFRFEVGADYMNGMVKALGSIDTVMALLDAAVYHTPECHMLPALEQLSLANIEKEIILPYNEVVSLRF